MYKLHETILILGFVGFFTACGSLPKPFAQSGGAQNNHLISTVSSSTVRVSVDQDLPEFLSRSLSEHMINALQSENILASAAANFKASYNLDGRLKISYLSKNDPEKIVISWTLSDSSGMILGALNYNFSGNRVDWLVLEKDPLSRLVDSMSSDIAKLLYSQEHSKELSSDMTSSGDRALLDNKLRLIKGFDTSSSKIRNDSSVFNQKIKIFLAEVSGAPGDGNNSLHRSLDEVMRILGQNIVLDRLKADFIVRGYVNVSPPFDFLNDVAITWLVITKEGRELGKSSQKNRIKAGRLAQHWGKVADIVAQEGAIGIVDIIERHLSSQDIEKPFITQ